VQNNPQQENRRIPNWLRREKVVDCTRVTLMNELKNNEYVPWNLTVPFSKSAGHSACQAYNQIISGKG
jgi:hypothetical protein